MAEQWLTYPQLAELWKITPEAARTRARRGRYQRRAGNAGQAEVCVDVDAPARPPRSGGQSRTPAPSTTPDTEAASAAAVRALEGHVETLRTQLARAEALADERSKDVAVERERVADLTARMLQVTAELMEARKPRTWWQRLTG
jgi:phage shock protein A